MTGCWTPWILNRASELLARPLGEWTWAEVAPRCPCGQSMVRRPVTWKCYRHKTPVVVKDALEVPVTPRVKVIA